MRLRRSRLTHRQTERLLEHFVAGTPARAAAPLVGVNRNTARLFYHRLRVIIAQCLRREHGQSGDVAIGTAGFERVRGYPVFALLKCGGRIQIAMLADAQDTPPPPAAVTRVRADAVICADTPDLPRVLDVSRLRHQRLSEAPRSTRRSALDSIENFWGQAKRHLHRYNGIPRRHLPLFLGECEWRCNYGAPGNLLKILKRWVKISRA